MAVGHPQMLSHQWAGSTADRVGNDSGPVQWLPLAYNLSKGHDEIWVLAESGLPQSKKQRGRGIVQIYKGSLLDGPTCVRFVGVGGDFRVTGTCKRPQAI